MFKTKRQAKKCGQKVS